MPHSKYIRYAVWAIFIAVVCVFLVRYQLQKPVAYVQNQPGQGAAHIGGAFNLVDQNSKARSLREFQGKIVMLYFGYTFCPDICPTGLQNMSDALKLLKKDREDVVPIFITIDPARDTVETLKLYSSNFHPSFLMLTGNQLQIDDVIRKFKVYVARSQEKHGLNDYLLDHSTLIYILDRNGSFLSQMPHTTAPEKIAQELMAVLFPKNRQPQ
jgi:cytochrome oxidase Cu insertion factor (SCO1/SenC/PrrC family)